LVEVLIVIVVISLLIAVIGTVSVKVMHGQKMALTQTIMRNTKMAIDRFAEADPLRSIYNRKGNVTFGPYPPYMLAGLDTGAPTPTNVREAVERYADYAGGGSFTYILSDRWHRDLGNRYGNVSDWVRIDETGPNARDKRKDDDIRALYAYLKVYSPETLSSLPAAAVKPLDPAYREYVNPTGAGTNPPPEDGSAIDVLGIHDAWGVPLDYFLYVKLEWDALANPPVGAWKVTQRIPALRSHGHSREEHDAESDEPSDAEKQNWIFSDPFPSPAARLPDKGDPTLPVGSAQNAGWVRARAGGSPTDPATWDDYDYVP
jgi:type II secretory pathway pseudopilin PulG